MNILTVRVDPTFREYIRRLAKTENRTISGLLYDLLLISVNQTYSTRFEKPKNQIVRNRNKRRTKKI